LRCPGAPLPSVALAVEYVQLALKYRATHQQVSKHLSAYLGPVLKTRPAARAQVLAFRGGDVPKPTRHAPKGQPPPPPVPTAVAGDAAPVSSSPTAAEPDTARAAAFAELCGVLEELGTDQHEGAASHRESLERSAASMPSEPSAERRVGGKRPAGDSTLEHEEAATKQRAS